jgi:hypothetical protein
MNKILAAQIGKSIENGVTTMAVKVTQSECGCNSGCRESTTSCEQSPIIHTEAPVSKPAWIIGVVSTTAGDVSQVATRLTREDIFSSWKARWSTFRMNYKVPPALYAVGKPDAESAVFVSANYKMSFDHLRKALKGLNAWILVIDTKGINVWCAAGKGTFGTEEIVGRINAVRLAKVVSHRTLILPQLGAPGVAAYEVQKLSGFKVVYGPVRAKDLPKFIKAGQKATPKMRVLTPIELVQVWKPVLIGFIIILIINLIGAGLGAFFKVICRTFIDLIPYFGAVVAGTVLTPILLPLIPVREFAWKGWLIGLLWAAAFIVYSKSVISWKLVVTYLLILPPISAYLAMNFTGSSTYTSLSGVVKEMSVAIPAMLISVGLGVAFLVVKIWIGF